MSNRIPTEPQILERFAEIVARSLRIARERVTADAYLGELGAESLDLIEITMETEDEFGVLMPQNDILHVAEELFGPDVLVHEGALTEAGVRFLQCRLPFDSGAIAVGLPVADVGRLFQRVGTWVRVIQGLLEHSPTNCPSCAATLSKPLAARLKCTSCGTEVDLPAGDDLNRRWVDEYYRNESTPVSDLRSPVPDASGHGAKTAAN
jgi:acyl carrier protein